VNEQVKVFPNPADNTINVSIEVAQSPFIAVKILDLKGVLYKDESFYLKEGPQQDISLNTGDLAEGTHIIEIEYSGSLFAEKIFIKRAN
jgi:hypothetical protein